MMLVAELLDLIQRLAPFELAQPGDNCGLLVGAQQANANHILTALELTDNVIDEAEAEGCDVILTHHPVLYTPVRSLVNANPREKLLLRLVRSDLTLIACHTNLDAAPGGLADIAGEALGLKEMTPLEMAAAGWYKLVGFIPAEAAEAVAEAVFASGAGRIGDYRECAFSTEGVGWFTPMAHSHPAVGEVSKPERAPELRWETVVPRGRLAHAIKAFTETHPYEEPAFDVYPVEDVLPRGGLGRVGRLGRPKSVRELALETAQAFGIDTVRWSGGGTRVVERVAVLPGSGRSLLEAAAGQCEVLITGDLGYHTAEQAAEMGLSLIEVPHGDWEWWAFRQWVTKVTPEFTGLGAAVTLSQRWRPSWTTLDKNAEPSTQADTKAKVRIWIDGGSRGNPGPAAIGVLMENDEGRVLGTVSRTIGVETNNVAEYNALLAGLELALQAEASHVEIVSDSELLVKQMKGEYKVRNQGLMPLYAKARALAGGFPAFDIRHVGREDNCRADALVNKALDEQERAGL